ncbi:DUF167 domain-containing protein [Candidatus Saccharibacteria bacterium]|nr:DUF167 domain-containing protein [Candidatus Saccharibacteria bacterium]
MKLRVTVKPGSSQSKIIQTDEGLTLYTHERAHDGEANTAVIKMLSKYYNVNKSSITIISGHKSRHKLIEIIGQ